MDWPPSARPSLCLPAFISNTPISPNDRERTDKFRLNKRWPRLFKDRGLRSWIDKWWHSPFPSLALLLFHYSPSPSCYVFLVFCFLFFNLLNRWTRVHHFSMFSVCLFCWSPWQMTSDLLRAYFSVCSYPCRYVVCFVGVLLCLFVCYCFLCRRDWKNCSTDT